MPKKNRKKSQSNLFQIIIVLLVLTVLILALGFGLNALFKFNPNFRIKQVRLNMPEELKAKFEKDNSLIGEPIFSVNLKEAAGYSSKKYPYLEYIRAVRRLPNCIEIEAKPRVPVFRTSEGLLIDANKVIFPNYFEKDYTNLVQVAGVVSKTTELGKPIDSANLKLAFEIKDKIFAIASFRSSALDSIYIGNVSDASFTFRDGPEIRIGSDDLEKRLFILEKIFTEAQDELGQIKYIDLRFKDPVMGYK
jgi:cell division septal protein FtsQ